MWKWTSNFNLNKCLLGCDLWPFRVRGKPKNCWTTQPALGILAHNEPDTYYKQINIGVTFSFKNLYPTFKIDIMWLHNYARLLEFFCKLLPNLLEMCVQIWMMLSKCRHACVETYFLHLHSQRVMFHECSLFWTLNLKKCL